MALHLAYGYISGRFIRPFGAPENGQVTLAPVAPQNLRDAQGAVAVTAPADTFDVVDGALAPERVGVGQYDVRFAFAGSVYPGYRIEVTAEHTEAVPLDLGLAAPPIPSPAVKFVLNEAMIAGAEKAAATAADAAREASADATDASTASRTAQAALAEATAARDDARRALEAASAAAEAAAADRDALQAQWGWTVHPDDPDLMLFSVPDTWLDPDDDRALILPIPTPRFAAA